MLKLFSEPRKTIKEFILYPITKNNPRLTPKPGNLSWFANYALNNMPIVIDKVFDLTPNIIKSLPFPLNHSMGFVYGLITGANPFCVVDQRINKNNPIIYNLFNGSCGMIACSILPKIAKSLIIPVLATIMPASAAFYTGWAISWLAKSWFDSMFMCSAEQNLNHIWLKILLHQLHL